MGISYILLIIISHFIVDFVFQGDKIIALRFPKSNNKNALSSTIKGNLIHSLQHMMGAMILVYLFCGYVQASMPFFEIFIISTMHFFIDEIKSYLILHKNHLKHNIGIFLVDQFLHMAVIVIIICKNKASFSLVLFNLININNQFSIENKVLWVILMVIIATYATGVFIKIFIKHLEVSNKTVINTTDKIIKSKTEINGARNGGFIIGVLERVFIVISICLVQPTMIGFVLAVKSVARFKKMEDESFAEYFIIGTLISFISAIFCGLAIKIVIS